MKGLKLLRIVEKENELLQDQIIGFLISGWYTNYYNGINVPEVDLSKRDRHLTEFYTKYKELADLDNWERKYVDMWFNLIQSLLEIDVNKSIDLIQNAIHAYESHPDKRFTPDHDAPRMLLGLIYMNNLQVKEARRIFQQIIENQIRLNTTIHLSWTYGVLSNLEILLGNLNEGMEYSQFQEKLARKNNNSIEVTWSLNNQATILEQQNDFDAAEKIMMMSLDVRLVSDDQQHIFFGHYNLFQHYYGLFKATGDRNQLNSAKTRLEVMKKEFQGTQINMIADYLEAAEAIINKHGTLSKKGRAVESFKRLVDSYPSMVELKLHLLDLLFEELIIVEDQDETIHEIDLIINDLSEHPIRKSPNTILTYVSQQMILARYHYYVKGSVKESFIIYSRLIDILDSMKLSFMKNSVENDLKKMENELSEWDMTVKSNEQLMERISRSKFNDYILDALTLASQNQ